MSDTRSAVPIEQRNYSKYYIVFSSILFLGTMWAVWDEVSTRRPWKEYQIAFADSLDARLHGKIDEAIFDVDSVSLQEADDAVRAAQDSMHGPAYLGTLATFNEVLRQVIDRTRDYQFSKSRGDEAYYFYKKSVHEGTPDAGEKEKLDEYTKEMDGFLAETKVLEARRDSLKEILEQYRQTLRTAQNTQADILKAVDKWQTKLRRVSSAPLQVKQVMMLDYDRNPFNDPKARIDRCQTCHLGWNEELMADAPEPFRQHPVPELLTMHNPETFGCTPCHRGQGAALTPGMAHGDDDEYWENPILSKADVWASCNECHENHSALKFAPQFTKSKRLMVESGCHGCHEIKGYTDLPKIGPELNNIGHKTSPAWVFRWIRDPKEYNPHTRMPNFRFADDQAEAITAYLFDVSAHGSFATPGTFPGGDARRGREVFTTVGCQACHTVGDNTRVREARGTSYDIAPELTRVGSKVNADWAYDWVRNPRHYNPTTKMPSLRLTDGEARDVVAYLMTLKDERAFPAKEIALASQSTIDRGKGLIREFGCNGCHTIPGMEKEGRVSVSLSNFGRKRVEEMDFGDTHVQHTWDDWVTNKLRNSRAFQTDRIVQKMPVFAFNDEEVQLIRMFLRSETKDEPDARYVQEFTKKQQNIEAGRRVAIMYNCQQCHQLEKAGGHIGAILEDVAFMPPIITGEGAKVQEPWLHDFLSNPSYVGQPNAIRPWIPTRMPTFHLSDDEINRLTMYFLALSDEELRVRDYAAYIPDPAMVRIGGSMFSDLQCAKCHPSGPYNPNATGLSTSDLAPNLAKARARLKPEWIVRWLADPGKIQEGTRMPTFFPDGMTALPDVLDGDAKKQMEALRDYVISIGSPVRTTVSMR